MISDANMIPLLLSQGKQRAVKVSTDAHLRDSAEADGTGAPLGHLCQSVC